jgi:WD40 repeat protein
LEAHIDQIRKVAFSPNGQRVVTASDDHTAGVWTVPEGRLLLKLQGHTAVVEAAVFSPDGDLLATSSADGTARIYRVLTLSDIAKILEG